MFDKKQSGSAPKDDKDKTSIPEQEEESEEKEGFKRGGHKRKSGGSVMGLASGGRPDRRARGGGVEHNPVSSAGKMSTLDYESGHRTNKDEEGAGRGTDKNAKGKG
jgi:hypothetical protein